MHYNISTTRAALVQRGCFGFPDPVYKTLRIIPTIPHQRVSSPEMNQQTREHSMRLTMQEAQIAAEIGNDPFGAVLAVDCQEQTAAIRTLQGSLSTVSRQIHIITHWVIRTLSIRITC